MRQGERQGSVLAVLDETVVAMGARLLRRWLEQPLLQLDTTVRAGRVAELLADPARRQHLRQALKGPDIERLLGRIACGTPMPANSWCVRRCNVCHSCARRSVWQHRCSGRAACVGEESIVTVLQRAIVDNPPPTIRDGGVIRPDYDANLWQRWYMKQMGTNSGSTIYKYTNASALALNP